MMVADDLRRQLADPAMWDGPGPDVRHRTLDAIAAEVAMETHRQMTAASEAQPGAGSIRGAGLALRVAAVAFAALMASAATFLAVGGDGPDDVDLAVALPEPAPETAVALAGTDALPTATATVALRRAPSGLEIILSDVVGLAPAEPDTYYAAWLKGPSGVVPIGSFHLRDDGEPIGLWAGVEPGQVVGEELARYEVVMVTEQAVDEPPVPSDRVLLVGPLPTGD